MSESNYKYSASSRIPTRPLSYENASLAMPRELILDYKNAKIYICDLSGKIVDITEKLIAQMKSAIDSTLNGNDIKETVKDVEIELEDGNIVSIESGFVQLFKQISDINKMIEDMNTDFDNTVQNLPTAATTIPLASAEDGSAGILSNSYALADHVHPKGLATIADEANSVSWDNVKDKPDLAPSDHVHNYLSTTLGGMVHGPIILDKGNGGYCGTSSDDKGVRMAHIDENDMIHIGHANAHPILLDAKIILSSDNYGEDPPSTEGAVEGQVYFQLI